MSSLVSFVGPFALIFCQPQPVTLLRDAQLFHRFVQSDVYKYAFFAPTNEAFAELDEATLKNVQSHWNKVRARDVILFHVALTNSLDQKALELTDARVLPLSADSLINAQIQTFRPPLMSPSPVFAMNAFVSNPQGTYTWNGDIFFVDDWLAPALFEFERAFPLPGQDVNSPGLHRAYRGTIMDFLLNSQYANIFSQIGMCLGFNFL